MIGAKPSWGCKRKILCRGFKFHMQLLHFAVSKKNSTSASQRMLSLNLNSQPYFLADAALLLLV
jgi:hypothetical protein